MSSSASNTSRSLSWVTKINSDATDKLTKLRGFTVNTLEDAITDMDRDVALLSKVKLKCELILQQKRGFFLFLPPPLSFLNFPNLPKNLLPLLRQVVPRALAESVPVMMIRPPLLQRYLRVLARLLALLLHLLIPPLLLHHLIPPLLLLLNSFLLLKGL